MVVRVAIQHNDDITTYDEISKAIYSDGEVTLVDESDTSEEIDGEIFGVTDGRSRLFIHPPEENAQVETIGDVTYAMRMPDDSIKIIHQNETLPSGTMTRYLRGRILNVQAYDD